MSVLWFVLIVALLGAAVVAGALFVRGQLPGAGLISRFMPRDAERRLDVVEQANVDGRRRLVLIRRDDVEHLIMTGGPVDVVIETGIGPPKDEPVKEVRESREARELKERSSVFSRQPPPLSKVSSEKLSAER
jgi:flagellar protein FliO/FliZ